jgi:hypothetical protein
MNPPLGAVVIGAKIKHLGASLIGTKLLAHVDVDAELTVTWQPARRQLYWRQSPLSQLGHGPTSKCGSIFQKHEKED